MGIACWYLRKISPEYLERADGVVLFAEVMLRRNNAKQYVQRESQDECQ